MTSPRRLRLARLLCWRPVRWAAIGVAALPVFQSTGCIPDPIGALNFQGQLLVSGVIIDAISTIVMNLLHL